ncbi:MAG: SMI1/KNR4 family protein [Verrucomicrobiota bacterium]
MIALLVVGLFAGRFALRSFLYPKPGQMPPVVAESTERLLEQLQSVLEKRAPAVLQSLQPGLSDKQIDELQAKGGFSLSPDLRAMYRWRNGSKSDFIPGHRFLPLEDVVAERDALASQNKAASWGGRMFYAAFAAHREPWVHILDDGAGDGYFHDPVRGKSGEFFYNMGEASYYVFFPSARNFLKGVIDGYEQEIFKVKDGGKDLDEDFEQAMKMWHRLGAANAE